MDLHYLFTEFEIGGNRLWRVLALFGIICLALVIGKVVRFILDKSAAALLKQQRVTLSVAFAAISRGVLFLATAVGISVGLEFLELRNRVYEVAATLTAVLTSIAIGHLLFWLVDVPVKWLTDLSARSKSRLDDMLIPIIRKSLRVTIVILILVQIAQILSDKPITSIIAGLGIGGLAVALAAQDTIKNFFGSIVLFIDKPFEMGDRIVADGHDGPVEEVGIRSTKIRTLEGHLVTIPNGRLADMTIRNIGKRHSIRRLFNLTVTYDTPPEKVERAVAIVKEILNNHEGMQADSPPRVFFNEFNADSLNIMVIYWYYPPDYINFMAFSEKLNLQIMRAFAAEGIEFAFPTHTAYLAQDERRPLHIRFSAETESGAAGGVVG